MNPTQYDELGYESQAPGLWRIIDRSTGRAIGPAYRSRAELLADLPRFAAVFGA